MVLRSLSHLGPNLKVEGLSFCTTLGFSLFVQSHCARSAREMDRNVWTYPIERPPKRRRFPSNSNHEINRAKQCFHTIPVALAGSADSLLCVRALIALLQHFVSVEEASGMAFGGFVIPCPLSLY